MHYQDHLTKFSYLRALKQKTGKSVAEELLLIFLMQGCPAILQSDNSREFANQVIPNVDVRVHVIQILVSVKNLTSCAIVVVMLVMLHVEININ